MTRVNANIPPKELKRAHLLAELREITMVPASLRRSLRTKTESEVLSSIPKEFCLNKNHVKFFYDKQQFLIDRFNALCDEMERRGYAPSHTREAAFYGLPKQFYGTWSATEADNDIVRERIALRISQKPHLYKD
jgi:deoxyribonuclease (pyrimidine dimer)